MPKQEKLYTVKELSEKLNVTDKRVYQLIQKYLYDTDDVPLTLMSNYIDYSTPKKKYRKATLSLLLSKQKQNSKFQRYHK